MAWGGAGGMWGGSGHQGSSAGNPGGGLPFAGIPGELRSRAEKLLADEPAWREPDVVFSQTETDRRPFGLRRLVAPHWRALVGAGALVVLETVSLQAGPKLTQLGIDRGVLREDLPALVAIGVLYLLAVVAGAVASGVRVAWTGRLGERLMFDLRVRVFSHLQRLSIDFFSGEKAGRIMTRMTSDIDALAQLLQEGIVQLGVQGLTLVFVTAILFATNVELALITVLLVVPAVTVLTLWFRAASNRGYLRVRDGIANVLSDLQESLSGVRIVTANNRQRYNVARHREIAGDYRDANRYMAHLQGVYGPGSELVGVLGQAVLLLVGGRMVLRGELTLGALAAFLLYLTQFFAPIQQLAQLYNTYQQGRAAIVKLREVLSAQPSVAEAPDAQVLPAIHGDICFEAVSFAYGDGPPVLNGLDLAVAAGETFALVGPTGAGKSTIAKLITRFYDPTSGRVLIDGHDLREVTLASLRHQLGTVPQEPFLFAGSIRDNIAFARPGATDEEVLHAVATVGLGDLVERLPDGIDSPVHERGSSLASGERQLLALARAFLAQPRVLVLDEATSNLDLQSETKIEAALDVLLEGRTAVIIAHRLSTAMRADRIGVIDGGRLVELGTHDELVARGGRYAEMYATWISHATR